MKCCECSTWNLMMMKELQHRRFLLNVCLSVCVYICLSVCLFICPSPIHRSIFLSVSPFVRPIFRPNNCLSSIYLSVLMPVFISICSTDSSSCLYDYPNVCPSVQSICLRFSLAFYLDFKSYNQPNSLQCSTICRRNFLLSSYLKDTNIWTQKCLKVVENTIVFLVSQWNIVWKLRWELLRYDKRQKFGLILSRKFNILPWIGFNNKVNIYTFMVRDRDGNTLSRVLFCWLLLFWISWLNSVLWFYCLSIGKH